MPTRCPGPPEMEPKRRRKKEGKKKKNVSGRRATPQENVMVEVPGQPSETLQYSTVTVLCY